MSKGKYKRKRERARKKKEEAAQKAVLMENEKIADDKQDATKKAAREASASQQPSRWERFKQWAKKDKTFTDWCIAAFTFVLAGAAIYQFIIMGSQLDTMRKDQRPWIKVTFTPFPLQSLAPVGGKIHLVNNGKTPARIVRGDFAVEPVKNGDQVEFHYPKAHVVTTTGMISPNDIPVDVPVERKKLASDGNTLESDPLTGAEFENLQPRINVFFVVYGTVSYSDFFGNDHWTKFCEFMVPGNAIGSVTAQRCTNYSDVDTK